MGPLSWLRIVAACALCGPWGTHEAAEITRIASGPEENKSLDVDFTVRFERSTRRGKITREGPSGDAVVDLTELQYQQTTSRIVPLRPVLTQSSCAREISVPCSV